MPFPLSITRFNKHITNRLFLIFAGWIPPFAIIEHQGRKSGRQYQTPILAFPATGGFVFALTYGRGVDWVKNLKAADSGVIRYNGDSNRVHNVSYVSYEDVKAIFPGMVRWFLESLHVEDCLLVEKVG